MAKFVYRMQSILDVKLKLESQAKIAYGIAPEAKMLTVEENMARALSIRWSDYDLAKAVSY